MHRLRRYSLTTWLIPGLHIKRWLIILIVGITLISLGLAYLLRSVYMTGSYPEFIYWTTLQFLPRWLRALLFSVVGLGITIWGFYELNRSPSAIPVAKCRQPQVTFSQQLL